MRKPACLLFLLPCLLCAQSTGGGQNGQTGNGALFLLPRVQVAPDGAQGGGGLTGGNGQGVGGITGVTRRTTTVGTQTLGAQFFAAGGVNVGTAAGPGGVLGISPGNVAVAQSSVRSQPAVAEAVAAKQPTTVQLSTLATAAQKGDAAARARLVEVARSSTQATPATKR